MNRSSPAVPLDSDMPAQSQAPSSDWIVRGTRPFMRVTLALFSAGLATFALLYCVQPILPVLSAQFGISPAASSISLSISTAMMALGLLVTGPLSDAIGRKSVMVTALLLAAICTLLSATMTSWHGILLMRGLIGLSLSGVAAVGMTYLSEEIHPSVVAFSMGLYISGNSIGGMSGRLISGVLTDFFSWRIAIAAIGCFALAAALMFWKILPESRHFRPASLRPRHLTINFRLHWRDAGLPLLFAEGLLLMGAFVTLFNYIGYRLLGAPWHLSQAVVGLLSVVYLTGSWSSPKAGALTSRFGRGPVMFGSTFIMLMGLLLTAVNGIALIFIGMMLFTAGFFAAHSVASGWIGPRARRAKGQASSLYLFSYYVGSSVAGTAGGFFWHQFGWGGLTLFISALLVLALWVAWQLHRRKL
ncbi:Inner membrane transport protein YnfM [Pantoea ananatis]|uniref:MFS transporter n=1 Tax=Pantoea ananas TaxID=553 RepID=UPI0021F7D7A3|nr:MFS transporter [Pantoea ananatis]MCW0317265.1 Inner membrane transport protein YnfM [Pantoea ananatis]MCW0335405.1 Inner membrane transport protein YnfM [Pantoea ananatis]MCW0383050.1 Inner membrane transport protein YnfM [Pantoea ananatis]MCW0407714.1 Inner membrane transport protein YnfM [Pantoea ananatis]MCW0427888.1 Inner membrane transport protein YnfM [Pantoea ananatis]